MTRVQLPSPARSQRIARIAWVVLLAAAWVVILSGSKRTVTDHYRYASKDWSAGKPLYDAHGGYFLYLPHAAILYTPFAALPDVPQELAWRLLTISLLALAVWRLAAAVPRPRMFLVMTIVVIPLAKSSSFNGQMTLPMSALTILALLDLAEKRWWRATWLLVLAVALKPLALIPFLLVAALYRPMLGRLGIGLAVLAVFPFLTQSPAYVVSQYEGFVRMVPVSSEYSYRMPHAQFFHMLRLAGLDTSPGARTLVRILAGVGTLALGWRIRRRFAQPLAEIYIYAVAACYVMLFSPRTENNTYSALAPALAVFLGHELLVENRPRAAAFLAVLALGTVSSYELGRQFTPREQAIWLAPLMCVFFVAYLLRKVLRPPETDRG